MPTGNQQREWILIFGYTKDASNVEFWIADVIDLLYAIWTVQFCRLSLWRLPGRRSSLLNRQHEIEFHLYFDEPRYWPVSVRLNSILGKGIISLLVQRLLSHQSSSVASCHCRPLSFHERNVSVEGWWWWEVVPWSRERVSLVPFMMLFRLYGAWGPNCNSPRCCLTFFCPLSF